MPARPPTPTPLPYPYQLVEDALNNAIRDIVAAMLPTHLNHTARATKLLTAARALRQATIELGHAADFHLAAAQKG